MSSTKVGFNSNKCMFCTNLYPKEQTYALQSPYIISNYWIICLKCKRLIEDKFDNLLFHKNEDVSSIYLLEKLFLMTIKIDKPSPAREGNDKLGSIDEDDFFTMFPFLKFKTNRWDPWEPDPWEHFADQFDLQNEIQPLDPRSSWYEIELSKGESVEVKDILFPVLNYNTKYREYRSIIELIQLNQGWFWSLKDNEYFHQSHPIFLSILLSAEQFSARNPRNHRLPESRIYQNPRLPNEIWLKIFEYFNFFDF
jgi:hypothetical protein